jgi:hypothetical protein
MRQEQWIISPSTFECCSCGPNWRPGTLHVQIEDQHYQLGCTYRIRSEGEQITFQVRHGPITAKIKEQASSIQASVWDNERMIATIFMMVRNEVGTKTITFKSEPMEKENL